MGNQPEAVDQQEAGAANHKRNNIEEIAAVIDYIEEHLMEEKMDLESIASIFHYSRYHLHRMFASVAGFPLHTYLTRRRLRQPGCWYGQTARFWRSRWRPDTRHSDHFPERFRSTFSTAPPATGKKGIFSLFS